MQLLVPTERAHSPAHTQLATNQQQAVKRMAQTKPLPRVQQIHSCRCCCGCRCGCRCSPTPARPLLPHLASPGAA